MAGSAVTAAIVAVQLLSCSSETNPFEVPPEVSYPDSLVCWAGTAVDPVSPTVTGKGEPQTYAVTPGLPQGLHLDSATGLLWGTPAGRAGASTHSVSACNTWGCGTAEAITVVVRPARPGPLAVSLHSGDTVLVAWDSVPGADSYTIYRAVNGAAMFGACGSVDTSLFRDTAFTAADCSLAYYVVASAAGVGVSLPSDTVGIVVQGSQSAPTITITSPDLTRDSAVVPAVSVTITGYVESQVPLLATTARVNGTSTPVTGATPWSVSATLLPAAWNTVTITATDNRHVASTETLWVFCQAGLAAPGAPQTVERLCTGLVLRWTSVPHCDRYMLLRGPAGQAPSTIAGTGITDTTYEDTGLASGAAYSYAVQGYYQRQIGGFTVGDTGGVSGTAACTSAICFQRRIDAGGVDEARAVVAVGDGFVIAGKSSDDVLVMSIDARGTETWRTKLGSAGADAAHSIASLTGGDVVVAGEWADGAWLGRFRSTGDTVWTRRQMQSSYSGYNAAAVSSDGGVLLSGWATDYVSGTSDVLLARYSIDGVRTWLRVVGTPTTDEWAESMADGGPAGYVLGCVSDAAGGGAGDVWLVGCSAQGDTLWTSPFGGPVAERGTAVVTATGGGWVFAATTRSYGSGGWDIWLVSIGASREVRWTKTYGGTGADAVSSLACPASDGYAVLGSTESFGSDSTDFWLLRTTQGGDTLWSARYGGISADEGCDLVTAADGGYVLVGSTMSFDAADADIFVVKADCRGKTLPLQ